MCVQTRGFEAFSLDALFGPFSKNSRTLKGHFAILSFVA